MNRAFPVVVALALHGCGGNVAIAPGSPSAFLYAGSREGVLGFAIDGRTGALSPVPGTPLAGPGSTVHPSNAFVYGSMPGARGEAGAITAYRIDRRTGALTPIEGSPFAVRGSSRGSTPGVIAVDPLGRFLYATGGSCVCPGGPIDYQAYPSETWVFSIDPATGALSLAEGSPWPGGFFPGQVLPEPSGRFVYVSNAGYNGRYDYAPGGIWAYAVDGAGRLATVPGSPFATVGPLTFHPSGRYLFGTVESDDYRPELRTYAIGARGDLRQVGLETIGGDGDELGDVATEPSGRFIYLPFDPFRPSGSPESLLGYAVDAAAGGLTPIPGAPFALPFDLRSLSVHPSGRLAFLVGFREGLFPAFIEPGSGAVTLAPEARQSTERFRANTVFDPSGRFLYLLSSPATHGVGIHEIEGYSVDVETGTMRPVPGSPFGVTRDAEGLFVVPALASP